MIVLAAVTLLVAPATAQAVAAGHPEEVLASLLATGAVLTARRQRQNWAALLLGLAVGTIAWAVPAAPCVLIALTDRRLTTALEAGAVSLLLTATLPIADPAAFARASKIVGSVHFTNALSPLGIIGSPVRMGAGGGLLPSAHQLPFGLTRSIAAMSVLAVGFGAIWFCRLLARVGPRRVDPLALLALVVSCVGSPIRIPSCTPPWRC